LFCSYWADNRWQLSKVLNKEKSIDSYALEVIFIDNSDQRYDNSKVWRTWQKDSWHQSSSRRGWRLVKQNSKTNLINTNDWFLFFSKKTHIFCTLLSPHILSTPHCHTLFHSIYPLAVVVYRMLFFFFSFFSFIL
jgi:hypothetical protein